MAKQRGDPLTAADSLNEPLPGLEGDDVELLEAIPDPGALEAFQEVEARIYRAQLHKALEESLSMIPTAQAEVIRERYYRRKTLDGVAAKRGCSRERVRQIESGGLRRLRQGEPFCRLKPFKEDIISHHGYHGGLGTFRSKRGSCVEIAVEKLEELKLRWNHIVSPAQE